MTDVKQRLVEALLKGSLPQPAGHANVIPRRPAKQLAPLAPIQQQIWLHAQMEPNRPIYNEPVTIHYRGKLDARALVEALRIVIQRHEILRTTFAEIDGRIMQVVHDVMQIDVPFSDLTRIPESQRIQEAERRATRDAVRPFDLGLGPLLRGRLFKLAEDYYRLHLIPHHLIADGVGMTRTVYPELAATYRAIIDGATPNLPEPRLQYGDFALWQQRWLEAGGAEPALAYWKQQLSGIGETAGLPTLRPRPAQSTYRGAVLNLEIPGRLAAAVKSTAKAESATPYMVMLAAFQALMHRYSGQSDVVVGGVTDGRSRPEIQDLPGYILNTVVLRTQVEGSQDFRSVLERAKETVLGAVAHSEVPFDVLVRELNPPRQQGRNPFFQVMFLIEPPLPHFDGAWDMTQGEISTGTAKFDLYVELEERGEAYAARLNYATDLFEEAEVRRIFAHWLTLLGSACKDPATPVGHLPLLDPRERREITEDWNATGEDAIPAQSVPAWIAQQARQTPRAIAVEAGATRWTFTELMERSGIIALQLQQAGIPKGSIVAICMNRGCEMVAALLGTWMAGSAYLPIDPALPAERQRFMLEDSGCAVMLTDRPRRSMAEGVRAIHIVASAGKTDVVEPVAVQGEDLAYLLYTSGSTGRPKGVAIPHRALTNFLSSMQREPGFSRNDTLLAVTTLSFDIAGLELWLPLVSGAKVVIASRDDARDPNVLASLMRESHCTVMQATPATWRSLLQSGWTGDAGLKVLCGGEALPADLAGELLPRCRELWNMYGPTETTIWSTVHRVREADLDRSIPIGRPIANTSVYVLDAELQPLPAGCTGELYIGGSGLADGYWKQPDLTAKRFVPSPFEDGQRLYRTGDLARFRSAGIIECLGRADDQVKIRGFRVELEEVEAALARHAGIAQAAVKPFTDASGNQALAAYLVANRTAEDAEVDWRAWLAAQLPDYMIPAQAIFLPALPMTPNGKLDRPALPVPSFDSTRSTSSADAAASADPILARLQAIWREILPAMDPAPDHAVSFFQIGGHSLLAAQLGKRVEREFGSRLTLSDIFQHPTLAQQAALLHARGTEPSRPFMIHRARGKAPLLWVGADQSFEQFIREIERERPFINLFPSPEELAALPLPWTIREVARCVVRNLLAEHPRGPYHLGGFCASALIAYESATQLEAAGHSIASLMLVEAPNPEYMRERTAKVRVRQRIATDLRKLVSLKPADAIRRMTVRMQTVPECISQLDAAADAYTPGEFSGVLSLFQNGDRPIGTDLGSSWRQAPVGSLEVLNCSGTFLDHASIYQGPAATDLARSILDCMQRGDQRILQLRHSQIA